MTATHVKLHAKTLSDDTAKYLHRVGFLRKKWDYPLWESVKYAAKCQLSFWHYSKKFYYTSEQRRRLAKFVLGTQPFTGIY